MLALIGLLGVSIGASVTIKPASAFAATAYTETVGGNANTWTNYTNAGGTQGPTISAYTSVQITCAIQGFAVADGNTWWYQIASSPWNDAYYVSADAFYNDGATSGTLLGTPFVDPAVPNCASLTNGVTETVGGNANTWTNYTNAGGTQGPTISAYTSVQITCAIQGFAVADGNTWWYQIASSPWNDAYYVSADAFYNDGATSGTLLGTPFVDPAVPNCSGVSVVDNPAVTLSQGPAAPAGYRYAITLSDFAPNSSVAVECYDSTSSGGFYSFSLTTSASGSAFTQIYCYSGDGPDHWVVANSTIQSNHVQWGSSITTIGPTGGGGGSGSGGSPSGGPSGVTSIQARRPLVTSVFYSPIPDIPSPYSDDDGHSYFNGPDTAQWDFIPETWTDNCNAAAAINVLRPAVVTTLSGWSLGRLGPIYALTDPTYFSEVRNVVLFDPGNTAEFSAGCDAQIDVNSILATWLQSNPANHLLVLTGAVSEDQNWLGESSFSGLWNYYFADIWNQPFASQALVCDYTNLGHYDVLADFRSAARTAPRTCPTAAGAPNPVAWNP